MENEMSLQYIFDNDVAGDGTGTVTVKGTDETIDSYVLYWGNDNGKLNNYTPIITLSRDEAFSGYHMVNCLAIAQGASRLLAYSKTGNTESDSYCKYVIPKNKRPIKKAPQDTMFFISDIHLYSRTDIGYSNFKDAICDIKLIDKNASCIVINGDLVTMGTEEEYALVKEVVEDCKENLPPIYYNLGNHDTHSAWNGGEIEGAEKNYTNATGNPYCYDVTVGHQHLIFLSEVSTLINITISKEHLAWLDRLLTEDEKQGKQSFLFVHQGIDETVTGTFSGQWMYHSIDNEAEFLEVLNKHPSVIMTSGHSHYTLDARVTALNGKGIRPSYINDASVAYLTLDHDIVNSDIDDVDGSQGMYVEVYEDKVLLHGYDFRNNEWISRACLRLDSVTSATKLPACLTIEGEEKVGQTLFAKLTNKSGIYQNDRLSYTWYLNNVKCGDIRSYTLQKSDANKKIILLVRDNETGRFTSKETKEIAN